jgi:hypothetical protein
MHHPYQHPGAGAILVKAGGIDQPVIDSRLMLEAAADVSRVDIITDPHRLLSGEQMATFDGYIERRLRREPVSHILGRKGFWKIMLNVTPHVLTPRPDTEVIVTNVGMTSIESRAAAEINKKQGHDLCMFLSPPASYEDQVIDHKDIYAECERKYGKPLEIAVKSTYNPVTKKYFGFSDSYVPDPVNYRKDLWDDVGVKPDTWYTLTGGVLTEVAP